MQRTINERWGSCGELWPASPTPASSAVSLAALPGPRPLEASRSSARPAARSTCSSWGCLSSDQWCAPSDANKGGNTVSNLCVTFHKKQKRCWPASAPPDFGLAASAPSGPSELPPPSASPRSAPLEDVPHWCRLAATSFSNETVRFKHAWEFSFCDAVLFLKTSWNETIYYLVHSGKYDYTYL